MSEYEQVRAELAQFRSELAEQRKLAYENSQAVAALAVASGKHELNIANVDQRGTDRFLTLEKRSQERWEALQQLLDPNNSPAFRERARSYFVGVDANTKRVSDIESKLADALHTLGEYKRSIAKRDAFIAALALLVFGQLIAKYIIK